MLNKLTHNQLRILIAAIGAFLFLPFIGSFHLFDWDEINFAESAREMLVTGKWRMVQIDFQPFYEKPPFFIWLQAISMKWFGVNEFAARFPNAVFGIITLLTVQNLGEKLYNRRLGVIWAGFFACSFLPALYFKSGIIDPVFNYFIFLSLAYLFRATRFSEFESRKASSAKHSRFIITSAVAMGLAILTKGPVALLLAFLTVLAHFILSKGRLRLNLGDLVSWMFIIIVIIAAWLSLEVKENGVRFIDEFVRYQVRLFSTQDAGHGGPWYFHFLVVLIGCFPASVFALCSFGKDQVEDNTQSHFRQWMIILLIVVLVVFTLVKTKIIHYSSLTFFPVTFLAAHALEKILRRNNFPNRMVNSLLLITGFALCTTLALLPFVGTHPQFIDSLQLDSFAKSCTRVRAGWGSWDYAPAVLLLFAMIALTWAILKQSTKSVLAMFPFLVACIMSVYVLFIPKIEKHIQHTYIQMLESLKKESHTHKVFVLPAGFKSYAHLYYFEKPYPISDREKDAESIIWGKHDGVVYLIGKDPAYKSQTWLPKTEMIKSENGWVLLKVVRD